MATPEQIALWRKDPVAFAEQCVIRRPDGTVGPIKLSPRQQSVLQALAAGYKTVALIWPKRSGKTLLGAIALLWKSLAPDRQSVCAANSREQAQALTFDMVQDILKRTRAFKGQYEAQRNQIDFEWGARIVCVPCNVRTCAGVPTTGLLISDESWAAFSEEPFHLLASQAESESAQIMLVSQASGRDKYLYSLWQKSESETDPSLWLDYIDPAELQRVGVAQANPNPYLDEAFVESRRHALPPYLFSIYWQNEFGTAGTLLDPDEVERCFSDELCEFHSKDQWEAQLTGWQEAGYVVEIGGGLDRSLPQANRDQSVITVTARVTQEDTDEPHYYPLRQTILPTGAESEVLAEFHHCFSIFGTFPSVLEVYQSADLVNRIPGAQLGNPTAQKQQELFSTLTRAVRDGRLHIPATCTVLKRQLFAMQVDLSGTLAKFSGGPGAAVDDAVYSLCWSCSEEALGPMTKKHRFSWSIDAVQGGIAPEESAEVGLDGRPIHATHQIAYRDPRQDLADLVKAAEEAAGKELAKRIAGHR